MSPREIVKLSLTAIDSTEVDIECLRCLINIVGIERVGRLMTNYPDKAKFQYNELPADYLEKIQETIQEIRHILNISA